MQQYLNLLQHILINGKKRTNRTGVDTIGIFGAQMRFDLSEGFPLLTTKKVFFRGMAEELLWFLTGSQNARELVDKKVHIWDQWMVDDGSILDGQIGPMYGTMWREWPSSNGLYIDQIKQVIEQIKTKPFSRRHIVSAWNPEFLPNESISPQDNVILGNQSLAPCHYSFQFYVEETVGKNRLSCMFNMRSSDAPIGLPFNIASYALLTMMIAHICDLEPGDLVYSAGDVHIYVNQIEGVMEQLNRQPSSLPKLSFKRKVKSIDDFVFNDFVLTNYNPQPTIKFPVAI